MHKMTPKDFREELKKVMPGYKWTVHNNNLYLNDETSGAFCATGIKSSGSNRTSTIQAIYRWDIGTSEYEVKSAGYGTKSPWVWEVTAQTLKKALRVLQTYYERQSALYGGCAADLQNGRKAGEGGL